MAGAATLRIVYDIEIQGKDDSRVATAEKAVHVITLMMNTGTYLGKTIHIYCVLLLISTKQLTCCQFVSEFEDPLHRHPLRLLTVKYVPTWFPGAKFKRDAAVWKTWVDEMYYGFYRQLKTEIVRMRAGLPVCG